MRPVLLGLAASLAVTTVPAAPVQAEGHHGDGGSVRIHSGPFAGPTRFSDVQCNNGGRARHRHDRDGDDNDRRDRDRRSGDCTIIGGDLGYLDYGDYDANRSFDPDLWNDWWHERPNRAYPAWVRRAAHSAQDCPPDRMWWSGNGWHC